MPPPITLLTDFGEADGYVAQMKGVILGLQPAATIVDISHAIAPQDIAAAAHLLADVVPAFPPQTIHVAVVDPGVGSARPLVGAEIGGQRFLAPDNGLLGEIARLLLVARVHLLTRTSFHRQPTSHTFHGRDILAPAAAYWSLGHDLSEFGPVWPKPLVCVPAPQAVASRDGVTGEVVRVDRFGNLLTNIPREMLLESAAAELRIHIGDRLIEGLSRFYTEQPAGCVLALIDSAGRLEIAANGGSAAASLGVGIGSPVRVQSAKK